VRRAINRQH